MSTLMAQKLMPFMAVGLVLPFTSLTAAQKQPVQQQEYNYKAESEALMKAISLAVDSKLEEHHGCISNKCALSSATPDQHQIVTSSKSSATTAEWPSIAEFLEMNKQTN